MNQIPTESLDVDVRVPLYERLYLFLDESEEYTADFQIVEDALDEYLPNASELP